jgi:voltage-gated potassium channel
VNGSPGSGTALAQGRRGIPPPGALAERLPFLRTASLGAGAFLTVAGFLAAIFPAPELYVDGFAGYDPPFDIAAGLLLIVLAVRIRERLPVVWFFSLLAPVLTGVIALLSPDAYSIACAVAASAFVAYLFPYRGGFYRGTVSGAPATDLAIVVAGIFSILFGIVGARWLGSEFRPPIRGWAQALYYTVTTISTNGSNFEPMTTTAQLFVVVLILLGVGTFLSAIVVLFLPFIERRLGRLAARLEKSHLQELEGHVVVCGSSGAARAAARVLRDQGTRVVVIAPDPKGIEASRAEGFRSFLGDPTTEDGLRAVGVDRARSVLVAQGSDAESLLTVITARSLSSGVRIVAVAASDDNIPKFRRAGASEAIGLTGVAARLMSEAALRPAESGQAAPTG